MPSRPLTRKVVMDYEDQRTGEVHEFATHHPIQKRRPKDKRETDPFVMVYPTTIGRLSYFKLQLTDYRVLFALVEQMGFDAPFRYSTKEIAANLGIAPTMVSRAIGHLRKEGLIVDRGNRMIYLHPEYFWRGNRINRMELLRELDAVNPGASEG